MNERNELRISLLLVDELLVAATESYVDSVLGVVNSSKFLRDRLKDERDEQLEDDESNAGLR